MGLEGTPHNKTAKQAPTWKMFWSYKSFADGEEEWNGYTLMQYIKFPTLFFYQQLLIYEIIIIIINLFSLPQLGWHPVAAVHHSNTSKTNHSNVKCNINRLKTSKQDITDFVKISIRNILTQNKSTKNKLHLSLQNLTKNIHNGTCKPSSRHRKFCTMEETTHLTTLSYQSVQIIIVWH